MKNAIFEITRTIFFAATICVILIYLGVIMNELWLVQLKLQPIFPELISAKKIAYVFVVTAAIVVITMLVLLFYYSLYLEKEVEKEIENDSVT